MIFLKAIFSTFSHNLSIDFRVIEFVYESGRIIFNISGILILDTSILKSFLRLLLIKTIYLRKPLQIILKLFILIQFIL